MMRPGFSLIEIIIALAISSFLAIVIFSSISLLQKSSKRYNQLISLESQQQLLFSQMQKDISAMVIPLYGFMPDPKETKEAQEKAQQEYRKNFGLQIEVERDQVKSISFVTTTVLAAYGVNKPRLCRVRYLMVPDAQHAGYFTLMRQESSQRALAEFERDIAEHTNQSHAIAFGIKSSSIACTSIQLQGGQKKVEEVSSWSFAELIKKQPQPNADGKIEQSIALPQIITLNGVIGDFFSDHEHAFSFSFFIPVDPVHTQQAQPVQQPTQQTNQPAQSPAGQPKPPAFTQRIGRI